MSTSLAEDANGELILLMNPTDSESDNPLYELENYNRRRIGAASWEAPTSGIRPWSGLKIDANVSFDRLDRNRENFREKGYRCYEPCPTHDAGNALQVQQSERGLNASITASTRWNVTDQIRNPPQVRYLYENEDYESFNIHGYGFAVAQVPTFDNINQDNISGGSYLSDHQGGRVLLHHELRHVRQVRGGRPDPERRKLPVRSRPAPAVVLPHRCRLAGEPGGLLQHPAVSTSSSSGTRSEPPAGARDYSAQYEVYSVSGGRISPVTLGNKNLKPEFSTEHEVGVDMGMFNYKTILSLTYAQTTTEDQILPVPQPSYTGFTRQWRNAGTIESKTYEATADFRLIERPDFTGAPRSSTTTPPPPSPS